MTMPDKILTEYRYDGQVALVTLNAPKGNVLGAGMMTELQAAFDNFASRPQLKLVQFTGSGKHFSFGASVAEHVRE
ncbi:MAG: enoyl-CoA hydratase, partial [Candidatus Zixiibacteriota bacterium]